MKSINDQLYGFSYELNHTTEEDLMKLLGTERK